MPCHSVFVLAMENTISVGSRSNIRGEKENKHYRVFQYRKDNQVDKLVYVHYTALMIRKCD